MRLGNSQPGSISGRLRRRYLALAQELDCPFWTADYRLYRVTRDTLPGVNLLPTSS